MPIQRTPERLAAAEFCGVRAFQTVGTAVTTGGGAVPIGFGAETFDTHGFHDNAVNNSRFVCPSGKGGRYLVIGKVAFPSHTTSSPYYQADIFKNGVMYESGLSADPNAGSPHYEYPAVMAIVDLAPGDYVELIARQNTGATLTTIAADGHTTFQMTYLGPTVLPKLDGGLSLIGHTTHNPGTAATYSTTSSTFTDLDPTNLAVTFVAPPSGKVLVRLTAVADKITAAGDHMWNLRDAVGDIAGTAMLVGYYINMLFARSTACVVSGLTPGQSYTWKWGQNAVGGTSRTYAGGASNGPAVMEVWSVQ